MQTKLTLRLEEKIIKKAKAWGKCGGLPVPGCFEFLSQLPEKVPPPALSPWTRGLAGVARGGGKPPTDEALRQEYLGHLETKHR